MGKNNTIKNLMIYTWGMKDIDWMGYSLKKGEHFSYHHTQQPVRLGGLTTVDNGSILCETSSHPYIHLIECYDLDIYVYITNYLISINSQREMPTRNQFLSIDAVLKQFEREYCSTRNRQGDLIIKEKYLKRVLTNKL